MGLLVSISRFGGAVNIPSGVGLGLGVRVGVGLGLGVRVGVIVGVGLGLGVKVGVGLGLGVRVGVGAGVVVPLDGFAATCPYHSLNRSLVSKINTTIKTIVMPHKIHNLLVLCSLFILFIVILFSSGHLSCRLSSKAHKNRRKNCHP